MNSQKNWKWLKISELFDVVLSAGDLQLENCEPGNTPLVSSGEANNGVIGFISEDGDGIAKKFPSNTITIDMFCHAFYHPYEYYAVSHGRVNILLPRFSINKEIALFICTLINRERYKYSYGRAVYSNVAANMKIKLPTNANGDIDFKWIEEYIHSLHYKPITTNRKESDKKISTRAWKHYRLDELFDFKKGTRLIKEDMEEGQINYLGAIDSNNGVRQKIYCEPEDQYKPNCITVNYNGSVGESFYQAEPFWASDDINVLYAKPWWELDQYLGMFIITIIKKNKYKFDYGRKWTLEKMKESTIILPSADDGKPDFQSMREYIRSLPYSDRI